MHNCDGLMALQSQPVHNRAATCPVAPVTRINFELPNFRLTYISLESAEF